MAIYEYKCDRCGDVFEVMQKFSDTPLQQHEGCGGHVERLLSAPALQFKGTGWYVTDYARNSGNGTAAGKSESKDKSESQGKAESKDKPSASKPHTPASTADKR
jgi:putative FmdB family regulatory protein